MQYVYEFALYSLRLVALPYFECGRSKCRSISFNGNSSVEHRSLEMTARYFLSILTFDEGAPPFIIYTAALLVRTGTGRTNKLF